MSNPVPSSLALTSIGAGSDILSADHRNNYSAVQTAVNALITALGGGVSGQVLQAASASAVQWGGGSFLAAPQKYGTLIDIVSSVAEVDILQAAGYTVAAGTLGALGVARVTLSGDYLNNVNSTGPVIRVYFGGTKIFDVTGNIPGPAVSATRHPFRLQFELSNCNATNVQSLNGFYVMGAAGVLTTGLGGGDTLSQAGGNGGFAEISGTGASDTTAGCLLRATAQLSASSASVELRVRSSLIEFI